MEKISLYDLLTILLPGALLTLSIQLIAIDYGFNVEDIHLNDYFSLTIFLSSSIFLGSLLNYITENLLSFLRYIGLYTPIVKLYPKLQKINIIRGFFDEMMLDFEKKSKAKLSEYDKIESVWSEIYFYLEANEKIGAPKAFQSFYFFFRNFFTLGLILFFPFLLLIFISTHADKYIALSIVNLIALILSVLAGKWNRKKMVERMFWTYYSLKKDKK